MIKRNLCGVRSTSESVCPLCGNKADENSIVDKVENIWQSPKKVYQCSNCKLYFIEKPSEYELESLYKSDFYSRKVNSHPIYIYIYIYIYNKMKYARALNRFNYIKKFIGIKDNLNVLEIGASDGLLLSLFKKRGMNVMGYELNEKARKTARDKYGLEMKENFLDDLDINYNKYDVVIMYHILEHFVEPKSTLKHIYGFLKNDGKLFVEVPYTPNYDTVSKDEMKIFFETEHTVHFNENNISFLMKELGFNILDISYDEYKASERIKKNIWLGKLDLKSSLDFLYFFLLICFNPSRAFINYKIEDKIDFSFGRNIRLVAVK